MTATRVGGHAAATDDLERPGVVAADRTDRLRRDRNGVSRMRAGVERDVGGAGGVRHEVAGHVEYDLGRLAGARSHEGDREGSLAESHRHAVGPIVPEREVERGTGRVVERSRTEIQVAGRVLPGDGQVARDGDGVGGHAAATDDLERPGVVAADRTDNSAETGTAVEDARRCERDVGGAGGVRHEVAGHVEYDLGRLAGARSHEGDREGSLAESHRHAVGPIVPEREVERGTGRVVERSRTEIQVAGRVLPGDGQVARDGDGVGGHAAATDDLERPGVVAADRTDNSAETGTAVEDARRCERDVGGAGGRSVAIEKSGVTAGGGGESRVPRLDRPGERSCPGRQEPREQQRRGSEAKRPIGTMTLRGATPPSARRRPCPDRGRRERLHQIPLPFGSRRMWTSAPRKGGRSGPTPSSSADGPAGSGRTPRS